MSSEMLDRKADAKTAEIPTTAGERERWAPYLAEGIGTFGLVFAGCGAIMIDRLSGGQVTHAGVGLVFGLIITVMIYALGHISGAHLNPAVTLGFVLVRHFPPRQPVGYWLAQLTGAILAAGCLRLLLGDTAGGSPRDWSNRRARGTLRRTHQRGVDESCSLAWTGTDRLDVDRPVGLCPCAAARCSGWSLRLPPVT